MKNLYSGPNFLNIYRKYSNILKLGVLVRVNFCWDRALHNLILGYQCTNMCLQSIYPVSLYQDWSHWTVTCYEYCIISYVIDTQARSVGKGGPVRKIVRGAQTLLSWPMLLF